VYGWQCGSGCVAVAVCSGWVAVAVSVAAAVTVSAAAAGWQCGSVDGRQSMVGRGGSGVRMSVRRCLPVWISVPRAKVSIPRATVSVPCATVRCQWQ
jgi:hypothetical protein